MRQIKKVLMNRELLQWSGPEGLPRFDLIRDTDFAPAFDQQLAAAEAAAEAIAANPEPPSFANTVAAMETADEGLNRVLSIFYTLASVDSNEARQALQRDFAPRLAEYGSRISMDPRLYARVKAVADNVAGLSPQDARITELALRDLTRAGAGLDAEYSPPACLGPDLFEALAPESAGGGGGAGSGEGAARPEVWSPGARRRAIPPPPCPFTAAPDPFGNRCWRSCWDSPPACRR